MPDRSVPDLPAIKQAFDALYATLVPFHEGKQEFFCKVCRYRDPLVNGTKLHDDACPLYLIVTEVDRLTVRLRQIEQLVRRYKQQHCANADAEGVSALCECKICVDVESDLQLAGQTDGPA